MKVVDDQEKDELLCELSRRRSGIDLGFRFRSTISEVHFLLYELNSWIGGPGDRVLILNDLAAYQPSFDGLWKNILSKSGSALEVPTIIEFGVFNYTNLDQLAESAQQRDEVQRILGLLALSIAGGCWVALLSRASKRMLELRGEIAVLFSDTELGIQEGREILSRYGLDL